MRIHSHSRLEPDPFAGAVSLVLGCAAAAELGGADDVTEGTGGLELVAAGGLELVAGAELAGGLELVAGGLELVAGAELAGWLEVRLEIALLMLLPMLELHAVTMPAVQSIVAPRNRLPVRRRITWSFPARGTSVPAFSLASSPSRRVTPNG
jgi:hypothetical protein